MSSDSFPLKPGEQDILRQMEVKVAELILPPNIAPKKDWYLEDQIPLVETPLSGAMLVGVRVPVWDLFGEWVLVPIHER